MSLFLSEKEREFFKVIGSDKVFANHYWALFNRVNELVSSPERTLPDTTTAYWHHIAEYLGDAAFLGAQRNSVEIKKYVRKTALDIADLPLNGWMGPAFRSRTGKQKGYLETAHLSIALSLALDLCPDAFSDEEYAHCADALKNKGIMLCRAWLNDLPHFLNNWTAVLVCGITLPAAVLGLKEELDYCAEYTARLPQIMQTDGSFGEGLQYANYYLWAFLLGNEALIRAGYPSASLERAGRYLEYCHYNLLMNKPLDGWGALPRPRCFNFDDCTAMFAPNPDLLALLGCRLKESMPQCAALAQQIYLRFYSENPAQGPFDRTTFGFIPRAGWMNLLFYMAMKNDNAAGTFENSRAFDNGISVIRTGNWSDSDLAIAVKAPAPELLNSTGHRHQDINSIQLFCEKERLLADPGHTCYRVPSRNDDISTANHSTCLFRLEDGKTVSQKKYSARQVEADGSFGAPLKVAGTLECVSTVDDVSVIVSEAAGNYSDEITLFRRFVIVCGKNAVFMMDEFDTTVPVKAVWNWCFNNRDGILEYKKTDDDSSSRMVVRRGNAGLKMFCADREKVGASGFRSGLLHDAYHPEVNTGGAGAPGSAIYGQHQEKSAATGFRRYMFPMAADRYGASAHWHLRSDEPLANALESYDAQQLWHVDATDRNDIVITDRKSGKTLHLRCENGKWSLSR